MWFRKNKIKENPKRLPFRGRQQPHNYSAWDSMSFIEKIAMLGLPVMLTFVDYMIIDGMFGFVWWLSATIATVSTILLLTFLWWFITWVTER